MNIRDYPGYIDSQILSFIPKSEPLYSVLTDCMSYSLGSGGKRIRPVLCLEFARLSGAAPEDALPFACAVEFIHTYSLIHDDLPCMDNDAERRGKPSAHIRYGEATALLAGDALLTHAFSTIAGTPLPPERIAAAVNCLASCAGVNGMIGGQVIDMYGETVCLGSDELFLQDKLKCAALITAACELGCIAAGNTDNIPAARRYGLNMGTAFQVVDDILDAAEGDAGSDARSGKSTYVSLLGPEGAKSAAERYTSSALLALDELDGDTDDLAELTRALLIRNY
ncbi:MAG: polyprenyl synthetase family protein [Clostridia bacterium]|nr:polyprenyl synthetase family protein [Clostridia bacterium]